jgi:hypothetical protein
MDNEIQFGYRDSATLTYAAFKPNGDTRTVPTSLPEAAPGYYTETDSAVVVGDAIIVYEGTNVVGWGLYADPSLATEAKQDNIIQSLEGIDENIDALVESQIILETTIETDGRTTTSLQMAAGINTDDEYIGLTAVFADTSDNWYARPITDYTAVDNVIEWASATLALPSGGSVIYIMHTTANAATEAKQDIIDTNIDRISAIQEGDEDFDYANGTVEVFPKGTTSNGLLKKNLYDKNDDIVSDTESIISRTEDVTP